MRPVVNTLSHIVSLIFQPRSLFPLYGFIINALKMPSQSQLNSPLNHTLRRRLASRSGHGASASHRNKTPQPSAEPRLPTPLPAHQQSHVNLGEILASGVSYRPTNNIGITTRPIRLTTKRTFYEASSSSGLDSDAIRSDDVDSELSNILPLGVSNRASHTWETIPYEARRVASLAKMKMEYIALMVKPWPNAADMEEFLS